MAGSLLKWFEKEENRAIINSLGKAGIEMVMPEKEGESSLFEGQIFVITGTLSRPREYFKDLILDAGGKVSDSISAKTTYLLAGENAGSKLKKAEKLGTKVITEKKFYDLLNK